MGQFTQLDPIGMSGGLNLYGYANSDPVNFRDPSGLTAECEPSGTDECPVIDIGQRITATVWNDGPTLYVPLTSFVPRETPSSLRPSIRAAVGVRGVGGRRSIRLTPEIPQCAIALFDIALSAAGAKALWNGLEAAGKGIAEGTKRLTQAKVYLRRYYYERGWRSHGGAQGRMRPDQLRSVGGDIFIAGADGEFGWKDLASLLPVIGTGLSVVDAYNHCL